MPTTKRFTRVIVNALFLCLFVAGLVITLFPRSSVSAATANNPNFLAYTNTGVQVLQGWYSSSNGQWDSQWWNSANELGTIIDYSRLTGKTAYTGDIATTFSDNSSGNFLNSYYDDEGWWGLTWVNAYDYTGNTTYLNMAKTIFSDMTGGWDSTCGGGIWWSKSHTYKNAIPNELFLTLAARLHERTPNDSSYLNWANQEWTWFSTSGLINSSNLINDGLNSSCQNNGGTTWTYNQGVILGGLTDMYKITANTSYLTTAESIANAAITTLVNPNGILEEPCESTANCNSDQAQFKGVLMRNLAYLYQADHQQTYEQFILANASSIWQNDHSSTSQFGLDWYGPFDSADPVRQSSALDALNAAISFSNVAAGTSPTNVALSKTATANGSCTSAETPDKAVDGSITNDSKWCSGTSNGQYWLQVDLGTPFDIVSFTLMHAGAGGENVLWNTQAFTIQLSNDAVNWSTVVSVANNTADVTTHPIPTTTAHYMKLNITVPQTDPNTVAARIYEFQAYAFPGGSTGESDPNNVGTSDDANTTFANYDGAGNSYSIEAIQGQGLNAGQPFTYNGVTFTWPTSSSLLPDNYQAVGQTIPVTPVTGATTLAFLGSATNGPSSGTATITYTDASTQTFTLGFADWNLASTDALPFQTRVVATMTYRNTPTGQQTIRTSLYYASVSLQTGKTIQSVTLPATVTQGHLHVFALGTKVGNDSTVIASDTTTYQLRNDGSIWRYTGTPMTGWLELDTNPATTAIAVSANDALYQLHSDGSIWVYTGTPLTGWTKLDNNPATIAIVASNSHLYQFHNDGSIWIYTGTPLTGWTKLDNNPATIAIVASNSHLYQFHNDGSIWVYTGTPLTGWTELDNNTKAAQIAVDANDDLYQLHTDGTVWKYAGTPLTGWTEIGNASTAVSLAASNSHLYQVRSDHSLWQYSGSGTTWQELDNTASTTAVSVSSNDTLYQLRSDGSIWQYTGTPLTGWTEIGNNAATTEIAANSSTLYQVRNDGTLWQYTGTPLTGWQQLA